MAFVMTGVIPEFGASGGAELWLLFVLVLGDSLGVPVPGDSALIIAGGLAAEGELELPAVIAVASVAAMIGDTLAFEVGRRGGRRVLAREGRLSAHRRAVLARADRFYERYGLAAVYVAKFVPGVRAVSAITAGTTRMPRVRFAVVNALACVSWTSLTASVAFAVGPAGAMALVAVGLVLAVGAVLAAFVRRRRRRSAEPARPV